MEPRKIKQNIINAVKDLVSSLMYYDRKEYEELSVSDIENAIEDGTISLEEIVVVFRDELFKIKE